MKAEAEFTKMVYVTSRRERPLKTERITQSEEAAHSLVCGNEHVKHGMGPFGAQMRIFTCEMSVDKQDIPPPEQSTCVVYSTSWYNTCLP